MIDDKMVLQSLIVRANKMLNSNRFDITDIRPIIEATGLKPSDADMKQLRLLHCVKWAEMQPELVQQVVECISRTFEGVAVVRHDNAGDFGGTNVVPFRIEQKEDVLCQNER